MKHHFHVPNKKIENPEGALCNFGHVGMGILIIHILFP